jgi:hypothetical protein
MNEKQPLYKIGDLLTEFVDGLDLTSGIITEIKYDPLDKEYIYSVLWNDMFQETEIFESIIKWRVENEIFTHHGVVI